MSHDGPGQRRGPKFAAEVRARQEIHVDAHQGDPMDFLRRLESAASAAAQGECQDRDKYRDKVFDWAVDSRNLFAAWSWLKSGDGDAPGLDGLRYSDVPPHETWRFLRELRQAVISGEYQPDALRPVEIPKGPGRGMRTLELPSIIDRTVGRAIVQAIRHFVDPSFDDNAFAPRIGLGRLHALALAQVHARNEDHWVWITQDIRNAFPSVPRGRLVDVLRSRMRNEDLVRLIEKLMDNGHRRGIPQGQPLCPWLLAVYLDHVLDKPWRRLHPDIPLLRWADDILVLCSGPDEARQAHADLERLLRPAGMLTKHSAAESIHDLRSGKATEWLGYELSRVNGQIQATISGKSWWNLEDQLIQSHSKPNSPIRVIQIVEGWIRELGPAFQPETAREQVSRVTSLLRSHGYEEGFHEEGLLHLWEKQAYVRWQEVLLVQEGKVRKADRGEVESQRVGSAVRHCDLQQGICSPGEPELGSPGAALPEFTLYTDGSCLGTTKVGGWAYTLQRADGGAKAEDSGAVRGTTNNRMELFAVIKGLESLAEPAKVNIVTDSVYIRKGIADWLPKWRSQGWRAGSERRLRPLANVDLWRRLDAQLGRHEVSVRWVPAHSGYVENEYCDWLARQAARRIEGQRRSTCVA